MSLVLQSLLPYPNSCQGTSPHQQGWDTKMAMLSFCGIDVSKDCLDVVVLPEGWFFSVSARSQSPQLALSRALDTSAGSSVPCSRRGCRCDVSTRTSFVSSPAPAACWPRTTASMRG